MTEISVVMPVRNGGVFLRAAVDSILSQSYSEFEFIVVEGGSTDGTLSVLEECARADSRLRILREAGAGICAALDQGCAAARGRYIARMDADDISLPDRLARQRAYLESHPEVAVLGGTAQLLNEHGVMEKWMRYPADPAELRERMMSVNAIVHPTVMLRKEVLEEVGGYRLRDAEDYDLWLRISDQHQVANLDEVLLQYRTHLDQASFVRAWRTTLAAACARHAARVRRAGGADPIGSAPLTDLASALAIGFPKERAGAELAEAAVSQANYFLANGRTAEAREMAGQFFRLIPKRLLSAKARHDLAYVQARASFGEGKRFAGIIALSRSMTADPRGVARFLGALARRSKPRN